MSKPVDDGPRDPAALRARAEARLRKGQPAPQAADDDPRRLVQELEVHRIELEMQNDELRAARHGLEAALERATELFDFAPIGYFLLGADGRIRDVNLAGARLLGAERQRLAGRDFADFVPAPRREAWRRFLADRLAAEGDAGDRSCELALGDAGAPVDVHVTAAVLARPEKAVLAAVEDISGRVRAEAQVSAEIRHRDDFLAALSHELRNPLAPIRNSVSVLQRVPPGSEPARRAQTIIERQVDHLTRLIDDLLDVTRISRGKVHLQFAPVELGDLLQGILADQAGDFVAAGIALTSDLAGAPAWIDADATRIVQVVTNLLGNALKFTPRGGRVDVALRREGGEAVLAVSDTGAGIDADLLTRLFEPFAQAPQTLDRSRGGLGLGLATVKALVELHGGRAEIASEGTDRGAVFTVRLPLRSAPPEAACPPAAAAAGPRRVLVIEDSPDAGAALVEVLALLGHTVRLATDGPSGLALAREFHPEVILCDLGLPGMDGYAVARAVREDAGLRHTRLVALSGYMQPEDRRRSAAAGFDRHEAKPTSIERLELVLRETAG